MSAMLRTLPELCRLTGATRHQLEYASRNVDPTLRAGPVRLWDRRRARQILANLRRIQQRRQINDLDLVLRAL